MKSKRSHEGYFLLDHTASPGNKRAPEGKKYETGTFTCSHCQKIVFWQMPTNARNSRHFDPRGHCRKCDRYLCKVCTYFYETTRECRNMERLFDQLQEKALREYAPMLPTIPVIGQAKGE